MFPWKPGLGLEPVAPGPAQVRARVLDSDARAGGRTRAHSWQGYLLVFTRLCKSDIVGKTGPMQKEQNRRFGPISGLRGP